LAERGVEVDPSCIWRWVQTYAPELNKRCRPYLKPTNKSYRTDETYIKVKGEDKYLYRAVDSTGQTIEFLLTAKRERGMLIVYSARPDVGLDRLPSGEHD
jgi:transposase-like protein